MKADIFSQAVTSVAKQYGIEEELIFKKTKQQEAVEARFMLYYICYNRPMMLKTIEAYMLERDFKVGHSVILYGIHRAAKKMKKDIDFRATVDKINKSISIK